MKKLGWTCLLGGLLILPGNLAGQGKVPLAQPKPGGFKLGVEFGQGYIPSGPRFVRIPFDRDPEAVHAEFLRQVRDFEMVKQLLGQIETDAKNRNMEGLRKNIELLEKQNPELFKKAGLSQLLPQVMEKEGPSPEKTKEIQAVVQKALEQAKATAPSPPVPANFKTMPTPPPVPTPTWEDTIKDWMRDLVQDAQNSPWFMNLMQDSPGLQDSLMDLKNILESRSEGDGWNSWLPDLSLAQTGWDKLSHLPVPDFSEMNLSLPEFGGFGGNVSVPVPGLPTTAPSSNWLWLLPILLALVLAWWWVGKRGFVRFARPGWQLGPWPVLPNRVATREQLIAGFDYLALLLLGAEAKTFNHRAIAMRLNDNPSLRKEAVNQLAALYEQARYAPEQEMSGAAMETARRNLCLLAGMPQS